MRIDEAIAQGGEPCFSFEFFPPKTPEGAANLEQALEELVRLEPTFVSVTYGAGGSTEERGRTVDIVSRITERYGLEALAHFTCVGATTEELRSMLARMAAAGVPSWGTPGAPHHHVAPTARRPARRRRAARAGAPGCRRPGWRAAR